MTIVILLWFEITHGFQLQESVRVTYPLNKRVLLITDSYIEVFGWGFGVCRESCLIPALGDEESCLSLCEEK